MFLQVQNAANSNGWMTVSTSGSRLMAQTPTQRLKIRTPSYLEPLTPNNLASRLSVSALLTPGGPRRSISTSCMTPAPLYQIPCRSYFQGDCTNLHCLDSHDPSLVAKCRFFLTKDVCSHGDKCEFRHDRPGLPDNRPRFDTVKYKAKDLENANEIRKKIAAEQKNNKELNREIYEKKVYTEHPNLGPNWSELILTEAMNKIKELKEAYSELDSHEDEKSTVAISINIITASPGGGEKSVDIQESNHDFSYLDTDFDGYFDEMLEWLPGCDLRKWSPKQVCDLYLEARFQQSLTAPNSLDLYHTLFSIYQPDQFKWAEFINYLKLTEDEIIKLMQAWIRFDGITELHIGGLYAGLMQIKNTTWTIEKMSKLLTKTIKSQRSSTDDFCFNLSSIVPDGCFFLGMAQYIDISIVSKLIKFYLRSKERKYEGECACETFECQCPSYVEWDLYGVHVFRPIFHYSGWDLSKKAKFFSQASEDLWIEAELKAILDQIFEEDEESKSVILKGCKSKESTEKIMKHFRFSNLDEFGQDLENVSITDDDVLVDEQTSDVIVDIMYRVCQNVKDDPEESGSYQQCTNASAIKCINSMCHDCCEDLTSVKCNTHSVNQIDTLPSFSNIASMNELNKLICTEEDEHWDFVTFGSIQPAMLFENSKDFEVFIAKQENVKLKKMQFSSGIGLLDNHIINLATQFGKDLEVLEILSCKSGETCKITDLCIPHLTKTCHNLLKLRLVACPKISDKSVIDILKHCSKLQSLEICGAAKYSGFLTDSCLEPLFEENNLQDLRLLNLLDQYFIHSTTIERLRRFRGTKLKVIIGEREGEEEDNSVDFMKKGFKSLFTTPF